MKETTKYKNNGPAYARHFALVMLVFCCGLSQLAVAQGSFTLTNGRLWWSNGLENQSDEAYRDPVAFDASRTDADGNWLEVHPHGEDHVTHITAQGDTYLALDISTPTEPKIVSKNHNSFDLYCVWHRTGYTGYYYQEWADADGTPYRYYLVGSSDEGLRVARSEVGKPLETSSYWYNWDFGAAVWEKPVIDGAQKNRYYWIMLQNRKRTNNGETMAESVWTLSNHCYQRPEDIYYTAYTGDADANAANLRYYDGVYDGYDYHPVGNGALFMPVLDTMYSDQVLSVGHDNNGVPYGMQKTTRGTGITLGASSLAYDPEATVTTTVTVNMKYKSGYVVPMTVMPHYTKYVEETYRRGIHLDYRFRSAEGVFGSAGQGTFRTHYQWIDNNGVELHDATPDSHLEDAAVDTIIFSVDNRSRRYVAVEPIARMSTHPSGTTLNFYAPPMGSHEVQVYVTVRYKNGTEQSDTTTLTLTYSKPVIDPQPVKGPVVRGAVYGGGRMANVGGGTTVLVHSADSIQTVYGGNDIAGWVQGDGGANLTIGTGFTGKDHPVHIGNVYGGGNGYYTYRGINMSPIHGYPYRYGSTALQYQNYYFGYKWNGVGLRPVDTMQIFNPYFTSPDGDYNDAAGDPYSIVTIDGKKCILRVRPDSKGAVYEWGAVPLSTLGANATYTALDSTSLVWDETKRITDFDFDYDPVYASPEEVDRAETGNGGNGTIPYIKTAHITVGVPEDTAMFIASNGDSTYVHNDYVVIDTLFGGARNAFIGVEANESNPENGVSIDINGGTLYAVFGGNNVGGSVANTSTVFVNVNDTKLIDSDEEIDESFMSGYGRDFGIRYLFGGGNLVDGSHANVTIRGGMIDTAYLGGNNATVMNPIGTVECLHGPTNQYGYSGHFICTNHTYPDGQTFTDPVRTLVADSSFFDGYGPSNFNPEVGKYNVRCLFGGNNSADMANLSAIQLHSGGISSVYGGGNQGDMNNDTSFTIPIYKTLFSKAYDLSLTTGEPIPGGWADIYGVASLPHKVGSIVTALHNSKIVCDYVFGGGRMGNIRNSCGVYLAGGIFGYVNGGNDVSGDVGSETGGGTYVVLDSNVLVVGDAIAGSDGYYHCDNGTGHYDDGELFDTYAEGGEALSYDPYNDYVGMLFPTHNNVNFYMRGGLVLGQVIGGGVHANVGFETTGDSIRTLDNNRASLTYGQRLERPIDLSAVGGEKRGSIHFLASGGRVRGNAFGGGFQSKIFGLAYLTLKDSIQIDGSFFSGNDCTGSVQSFGAYLNPNDLHLTADMTAADSAAAYEAAYSAMVTSDGSALNSKSGNSWVSNYEAYLRVNGTPNIAAVYGSGNGAYNYDGKRPEYQSISFCPDPNGTLTPKQSSTFIDVNTSGGTINTVFGGGNGVGVESSVVVLLNNTADTVHTVHTIFGGNNSDDMNDVVPEIRLTRGVVNTVFGGSNNGAMGAKKNFVDALGNTVKEVSTHVVLESPNITVLDTVFGGCRMSNVNGSSFVEVKNTKDDGVKYIFGGNDISGEISGISRVDVHGGTVKNLFGGSNGRYDFVEVGDNQYNIYPFKFVDEHPTWFDGHTVLSHADSVSLQKALITVAARPDVDSTHVHLWGGTVGEENNEIGGVYGGGSMADGRTTCLIVNDTVDGKTSDLTIHGSIFGGGMGNYADLNARDLQGNRYGNISEATHVHLYHAMEVGTAKAYGGGRGGDVMNTYITTYSGWDTPFEEMYGGCWGSDVYGTAHLDFSGINLVKNLFGGNDFSGDVYKTDININSGLFNSIYGAGNGNYPDSVYSTGVYADDLTTDPLHPKYRSIHRPNTEYVSMTVNNGEVEGDVFGGGKLGTTWAYKKDVSTHQYILDNGRKIPDVNRSLADHNGNSFAPSAIDSLPHSNPQDYSYIVLNVHGGTFHRSIFAGAQGSKGQDSLLVYGLKVLNMDGGMVEESVYGGSQSVHDGYPSECVTDEDYYGYNYGWSNAEDAYPAYLASAASTRRPSSIVNLTGGTVDGNVYGAGYLGTTYGSVFVNIGQKAIESSEAYSLTFPFDGGATDSTYLAFKPGNANGLSDELVASPLLLNHSVYAGPNWGTASGVSDFTKLEGFCGGVSSIQIDGDGYNTDNRELNPYPLMNIQKSVFGSGTSVNGGDLRSDITIRNYGAMVDCHPTKELESVQRCDSLFFNKDAIHFLGASDATSSLTSEPFSLKNNTRVGFRGYNVMELDAPVSNQQLLYVFEEEDSEEGTPQLVSVETLNQVDVPEFYDPCGSEDICQQQYMVDPTEASKQHTLFILNNGIEFNMRTEYGYGYIYGYSYVAAPSGTGPTITAQGNYSPYWSENYAWNEGMSGFVLGCKELNQYTANNTVADIVWQEPDDPNTAEFPYVNSSNGPATHRLWQLDGYRSREVTIHAHSDPAKLPTENKSVTIDGRKLALAQAEITLPAADSGHYYRLDPSSINISSENDIANLVDSAWSTYRQFLSISSNAPEGSWATSPMPIVGSRSSVQDIQNSPSNTFGLVMMPFGVDSYFDHGGFEYDDDAGSFVMPANSVGRSSTLVVTGNSYVNSVASYSSPIISKGENGVKAMPKMNLLLTYDTNFFTTFYGGVTFILNECETRHDPVTGVDEEVVVSSVHVKVNINTILDEFKPMTTNVLAMYNAGRTNTFTRKVILPATLEEDREIYLKSVYWVPTNGMGEEVLDTNIFFLVGDEASITEATPYTVNNRFALNIIPSDNVSSAVASNLGWSHIREHNINVYDLKTNPSHSRPVRYSDSSATLNPRAVEFPGDGKLIGTLDGRGDAVLNVQLTFDGNRIYPKAVDLGYVGKVVLNLRSYLSGTPQEFPLTIYVKTRDHGDTIYLASADSVRRGSYKVKPYISNPDYIAAMMGDANDQLAASNKIGKFPSWYVQSFQEALSSKVYQEGDIIAILDTVKIVNGQSVSIHGGDGAPIEVMRYDGHHHEFPTENGVYRGPMIQVENNQSRFTARNIAFHGGAGAQIKRSGPADVGMPDTNQVFSPIIQVMNSGAVTLADGAVVNHNWNAYGMASSQRDADGLPLFSRNMGAISVTDNGTLTLQNDVTIERNFSHTYEGDNPALDGMGYEPLRPYNGAVYVDGGHLVLPQSNPLSAVDITKNWLVDPHIHDNPSTVRWWDTVYDPIHNNPVRLRFREDKVEGWQKANLLLTRVASSVGDVMNDYQSDAVNVSGAVSPATRIGVRKWFPGLTERDTIRIANTNSGNLMVLSLANTNDNFSSDDGYRVFFNSKVNNNNLYFFRCATFKHQMTGMNLPLAKADGSGYYGGQDVLHYGALESTSCPTGGDTLIYRLQGGFAPYSYSWAMKGDDGVYNDVMREYTTSYSNTLVQSDLGNGDTTRYWASIADTLLTPSLNMSNNLRRLEIELRVSAVDATGECSLYKDVKIDIEKMGDLGTRQLWEPVTSPANGWSDTSRMVTAEGSRNYRAIRITPYVWTDASQGKISAKVGDTRIIYQEYGENEGHGLDTLLFCEGEVIRLKTHPTYAGAEFLMWNFEPFNDNPISYVVPPHDDDVIAYYSSKIHWSDTINTPAEAGVAQTTTYYYESRPTVASYKLFNSKGNPIDETKAGYVTTYSGDVHIYNENGLAWFISIVNGLNGYQARPFRFNTVYLHKKPQVDDGEGNLVDVPYDMQKFLWSPLGTRQYGFRGQLVGVGSSDTATIPLSDGDRVVVRNVVLNEPGMNYVGFFGTLNMAECAGVALQDIFVRGGQYVGGFAAQATNTTIDNCAVVSDPARANMTTTTSIIATNYVSGGMVGDASNSTIKNSAVEAKYTGNAVHSGGVTGVGLSDVITNNSVRVDGYMSGLYLGGVTGNESAPQEGDCIRSISASIVGTNDSGYVVRVTWESSSRNVSVGYCAGEGWHENASLYSVRGSRTDITIPYDADTSIQGYTIAVQAQCNDTTSSMLTAYVSVEGYSPYVICPDYAVEASIVDGVLTVHWYSIEDMEVSDNATVNVGYCVGTTWNSAATTTQYPASQGYTDEGATFTLSNYSDTLAYTVALYSPCNDEWYTYTISACPIYRILSANYNEPDADGANTSHTVTLLWRTMTETTEETVKVGICPGNTWRPTATTDPWTEIRPNLDNEGLYSYDFSLDNFIAAYPSCSTYTVALQSTCSGGIYTQTVAVNINTCPQYRVSAVYNGPSADNNNMSSVTVFWMNDADFSEDSVAVTICAGCSEDGTGRNCEQFVISANSSETNDGSSYTFSVDSIAPASYACTTYVVMLKSLCNGQEYTTSTDETFVPDNPQGSLAPLAGKGRGGKSAGGRSVIANNYVHIVGNSKSQRIGGIAGRATNTDIMNNYVYGTVGGSETGGSVTAVMDQGTRAVDNFSAHGTARRNVGHQLGGMLSNSAGFEGQGNRVTLDKSIQGVNNLTRALNKWVRVKNAEGGEYKTWRSDLEGVNNGYPLFGIPDMIPVESNRVIDGCGEVAFDGLYYTRDTVVTTRIIDYEEMVDSIVTATIRLHYGMRTLVSDSVEYGENYSGYGFSISSDELRMLEQTLDEEGRASIVLHDTLSTAYGCDSIVTLMLTFTGSPDLPPSVETEFSVNVYPNPTTGVVNVEADGMTHVEVYDNEGRKLQDYDAYNRSRLTIDMTNYVTGVYFVRVHSPEKVVIQKVIKQR